MKYLLLIIILLLPSFSAQSASGFVLSNAMTLGQGNSAFAAIVSTNSITTRIISSYNIHFENFAFGTIGQYGLLDNLDVMFGFGGVSYAITPNIGMEMTGGTFVGCGLKCNIIDERNDSPFSVALLLQHLEIPANLFDTGVEIKGVDYDTYYKVIVSKNFPTFFPYITLGINSRYLKIGNDSSSSNIGQIDIGYGTPVTEKIFMGIELNWSAYWHDTVMDSILGAETLSSALGYSVGIQYLL